jgi:hypothetical protein
MAVLCCGAVVVRLPNTLQMNTRHEFSIQFLQWEWEGFCGRILAVISTSQNSMLQNI